MQDDQADTATPGAEPPRPPATGRDAAPAVANGREGRAVAAPEGAEEGATGARPPEAYTEPPGSHRRPEDGAALDVGG